MFTIKIEVGREAPSLPGTNKKSPREPKHPEGREASFVCQQHVVQI